MGKVFTEFDKWYDLYDIIFIRFLYRKNVRYSQLPDKSIAALVRYYYSWKKTRARSSLMDRQVRRMVTSRTGEESSSIESAEPVATAAVPSDSDEDKNDTVIAFSFESIHFLNFRI